MAPPREAAAAGDLELIKTLYDALGLARDQLQVVNLDIFHRLVLKSLLADLDEESRNAASQVFMQHAHAAFGKQSPYDLDPRPHQSTALNRAILDSPEPTELLSQELERANASKVALERIYSALRGSINRLSRPYLRKQTLIDLPDEILLEIFSHLDNIIPLGLRPYSLWHSSADIKALRLVCRRLSDIASHLLVRVVHLDLHSESSLKRMEEISRHPTISRGVHVISVNLMFYNASFIELENFLSYYADDTENNINMYEEARLWELNNASEEVAAQFISQGKELVATLHRLSSGERSDEDERHASHVNVTHQKYLELLQQQDSLLQSDSFYRAVGSAIARMPCARSFVFDDGHIRISGGGQIRMVPGADIWENLRSRMLVPLRGDIVNRGHLVPPSIRCMLRLIDAVRIAGATSLHHLEIKLSSLGRSKDLVPAPDSRSLFSSGMQQLRTFTFQQGYSEDFGEDGEDHAGGVKSMVEFFSACLDTSSLRGLQLDLRRGSEQNPLKKLRLKDIFNQKRPLDNLTDVSLSNFDFDCIDLVSFLRRLPTPMWCLSLLSIGLINDNGSWREVLDALREKKPTVALFKDPAGAECDDMTVAQYNALFRDNSWGYRNQAEAYIRGLLVNNPISQVLQDSASSVEGDDIMDEEE